jgi:membrane dipeptidase
MRALADAGGVVIAYVRSSFVSAECVTGMPIYARKPSHAERTPQISTSCVSSRRNKSSHDGKPRCFTRLNISNMRGIVGGDSIGLGGDYDGMSEVPLGLEDVSCYPALFAALLERGWSVTECTKPTARNILRVFDETENVANLSLDSSNGTCHKPRPRRPQLQAQPSQAPRPMTRGFCSP